MFIDKINRPSQLRWAIRFLFCSYFSTSKASPNDSEIVIVIIIIVDEAEQGLHSDGIIAQRYYFGSIFFPRENNHPIAIAKAMRRAMSMKKDGDWNQ